MKKLIKSLVLFGGLLASINIAIASPWDPGGTREIPIYKDITGTTNIDGTGTIKIDGHNAINIDGNSTITSDGNSIEDLPKSEEE